MKLESKKIKPLIEPNDLSSDPDIVETSPTPDQLIYRQGKLNSPDLCQAP